MIGTGPKNINKEILIPGNQTVGSKGGISHLLGKNSAKKDFQSIIEGEIAGSEEVLGGHRSSALKILSNKGALGKKDSALGKLNLAQLKIEGDVTRENGGQLEKMIGHKKVTPLKLGLSSGNNQKYEKKIEEFLQNKNNPGMIKNPHVSAMRNQNANHVFNKVNLDKIENQNLIVSNNVSANLNKYQKLSTKDKNNIVKLNVGESKIAKN